MENTIDLKNKNVLITGASRGIGAGIAHAMAACGANLMINHYQDQQNAQALTAELGDRYGVRANTFAADIADKREILAMFRDFDNTHGAIDILVNNAGCETVEHAVDLEPETWDRVLNVNLRGAFFCAQEAARRMIPRNSGVILNISSIHDKIPRKGLIHYCSAKAGLNMMTKCLALELAEHRIRVLAVSPGAIETEMNRREIESFGRDKFDGWIPMGRLGSVEDVAWTCAFLASDKAAYFTATELYIDGGYKETTIPYDPRPKK